MSAPLLLLDPASPVPPSEQIREQLRLLIATRRLLPGAELPSVRQLARDLGAAPDLVCYPARRLIVNILVPRHHLGRIYMSSAVCSGEGQQHCLPV